MSITTISTRSNGSVKPLRGKENYISWSIEIENVLLQNNNSAYIHNGSRAAQPGTQYLNDYNQQLEQYDLDLELTMLPLPHLKLQVNKDKPLCVLHSQENPMRQKEKRRN